MMCILLVVLASYYYQGSVCMSLLPISQLAWFDLICWSQGRGKGLWQGLETAAHSGGKLANF